MRKGSLTGAIQQKIFMGDGARRDRDVGENEEIGEPQATADGGGASTFFDFFEIVGLGGDGGKG